LAIFAIPLLAGDALQGALLRAMTFMIVASPCAVVLATMPPLLLAEVLPTKARPAEEQDRPHEGVVAVLRGLPELARR
jgi:hypothetical protein